MTTRFVGALVAALWLACSSETGPTRDDCARVHEHVVDLQLAGARGTSSVDDPQRAALLAKHRANLLGSAAAARHVDDCVAARNSAFVDCALGAKTLDGYRACEAGGGR